MDTRFFSWFPALALLSLAALVGCEPPEAAESASASPERLAQVRTRVRAGTAETAKLHLEHSFTGVVEPYREAMVASEVGGRVVARFVEPGDEVRAGDALMQLDVSRLQIARDRASAAHAARKVELSDALRSFQRGKRLIETGAISDHELDGLVLLAEKARAEVDMAEAALREATKNIADAEVLAPFDGRVEMVLAQVGDYLSQGQRVARMVDFSKARVGIGVTAGEAASLDLGHEVQMGLESVRMGAITGVVRSIGRSSSRQGLFPVEVWVEGDDTSGLRQGMVVSVELKVEPDAARVLVPSSAVFRRQGVTQVFRVDARQRAHLVPVVTGLASGGRVQILEGVSAGDRVITEGQFALADGAEVEVIR